VVEFQVKNGVPYTATLMDLMGRELRPLSSGVGASSVRLNIDGVPLSSGTYFVKIATSSQSELVPLQYIR
jgi:hypothetical protein